jgi:hypothetical protein
MAILLKRAGTNSRHVSEITKFIDGAIVGVSDKEFVYKFLPDYLLELAPKRGAAEHRRPVTHAEMTMLRNKALGIGTDSYIKKLLLIKKKMRN